MSIKTFLVLITAVVCFFANDASAQKRSAKAVAAKNVSVTITDFQFAPKTITVKVGSTVTWVNKEGSHTVTADNGSWASPTLSAGKSYSRKFAKAGTYKYYCSFHGSAGGGDMAGTIIVKP